MQIDRRFTGASFNCHFMNPSCYDRPKKCYFLESSTIASSIETTFNPAQPADTSRQPCLQNTTRNSINAFLLILFGLLHIADGIITYLALLYADTAEINPLLNTVADSIGLGHAILLLKFVCLAVIAYLYFERRKMKNLSGTMALICANCFYLWVVINNTMLLMD